MKRATCQRILTLLTRPERLRPDGAGGRYLRTYTNAARLPARMARKDAVLTTEGVLKAVEARGFLVLRSDLPFVAVARNATLCVPAEPGSLLGRPLGGSWVRDIQPDEAELCPLARWLYRHWVYGFPLTGVTKDGKRVRQAVRPIGPTEGDTDYWNALAGAVQRGNRFEQIEVGLARCKVPESPLSLPLPKVVLLTKPGARSKYDFMGW